MHRVTPQFHTPADEPVDHAVLEHRAASVGHLLRDRVAATPHAPAFLHAVAGEGGEEWATVSWGELGEVVRELGAGIIALGVEPEERVAIASGTRYEWALADLAVMVAGAATTTIYPTTIADDVAFILEDSATRVVFAEDTGQLETLRAIRHRIPGVGRVVLMEGTPDADDWTLTLEELRALGREYLDGDPGAVDARIDALGPQRLATIIYTSGTTGRPKGVRLQHGAWTYEAAATDAIHILDEDDVQYLWLPLAHVFGKNLLTLTLQIGFATAIDGRVDRIVDNLAVVRPTFMGAAPRIFEKAYARVSMMMEAEGGLKLRLFRAASRTGREVSVLREQGTAPTGLLAWRHAVLDRLVGRKIRERFGGNIRMFISGSAPLDPDVARWFDAMGMLVAEGYGLTETSAASCVNRPRAYRYGTVGWPLPGIEVRIADDGEVLVRGPGNMEGYHNAPEATAETLEPDGWLHTGDIGELDERGFLRITDRKKDLFKTSGGKYVAPGVIEARFKGLCPYASQLVVHGAGRSFVSALITLDPEAISGWAAEHGMAGRPYAEVVASEACRAMVQGYVDELNAGLNRWETVKRFTILDEDLSIEQGELTPSLKLRRKAVAERYRDTLDAHYSDS
ncbi:long-chain fatty acid--CoA ligase [Phycicoccus endophyticus]|uniref:Long-chain fatty acid--CoA ligase n=1 Tax=Phycicoccus endophyticus TaxID=1690220 RepID=A0A7G9R5C8_9MICO|nr:long-chain fatty acid--CoA ligase [Phycicoccus endophyticus]NHI20971.1 long-chain fatty acid--CoA ligase [Phycicoccus endophyticus]QNN50803.1 long-chain fatty acid--CoA ligase [Phycicoccus endophyticus]GGL40442.1 AMP-dependent synthetase [Phycicoccus endophyticus]